MDLLNASEHFPIPLEQTTYPSSSDNSVFVEADARQSLLLSILGLPSVRPLAFIVPPAIARILKILTPHVMIVVSSLNFKAKNFSFPALPAAAIEGLVSPSSRWLSLSRTPLHCYHRPLPVAAKSFPEGEKVKNLTSLCICSLKTANCSIVSQLHTKISGFLPTCLVAQMFSSGWIAKEVMSSLWKLKNSCVISCGLSLMPSAAVW